ncbi:MAG TPA: hypothetical protein VMM79_14360 [Longimicrobiales bacterium]|nr:hypothetical protein [Longimicrobiales bacterium]
MARPGRRAPEARLRLEPWMIPWASGDELTADERPEPYFASPVLLRAALEHVHGCTFADWLRARPGPLHVGAVIHRNGIVARLSEADVAVIEAGGDPWSQR